MKSKRKWISKCAMTLGVLTMLGTAGAGTVDVVFAAPQISNNPVSDDDPTSKRTVTIWKYEINSSAELGERGDGDPTKAPDLSGKNLMNDVKFEIIKVEAIGGASLTNPLEQKEGTAWNRVSGFTPIEKVTGADGVDGSLTFDVGSGKTADGIYLVRELPSGKDANGNDLYTYTNPKTGEKNLKVSKPMDPFFVHLPQTKRDDTGKLIYDVHVYPKNIVTDTELDKTINGGKGYSIKAGNSFQWEATTTLPDGLYAIAPNDMTIPNYVDPATPNAPGADKNFNKDDEIYASYFNVSDSINENLLLEDVKVNAIDGAGNPVTFTNGTEYTVTLDTGSGATVIAPGSKVEELSIGAKKDVVVSLTKEGMKKIGVDKLPKLQVVYKVTTNKDFNGTISNKYKINYLLPGGTPDKGESDEPEYHTGGFDIKKIDEKSAFLDGAVFHIADSKANADSKKYLASNGKSYTMADDGTGVDMPSGVEFLKAESKNGGLASFDGLKLEWFTDDDGDGHQDPSNPKEGTWPKTDPGNNGNFISKDYWVVETKSPSGYELLKDPEKVTVTLDTEDDAVIEVEVVNKKKTDLPFTGGAGMTLMIVVALGAITVGTATIVIERKKRQA